MRAVFLTIFVLVFFSSCATKVSDSNLYWGKYSNTLYKVKKEPSKATNAAHEEELQSIVKNSIDMSLRVPPGIYAELGLYAMERGDQNAAQNYFRLEQETYPEGTILMQQTLSN